MNLLESYKQDLKKYNDLKEDIKSIKIDNLNIYNTINQLTKLFYHINIYDKYYNIKSIIEKKENNKTKEITELYSLFELTQNNIINQITTKININDIDESYKLYIKNVVKNKKNNEYEKLYNESEKIFNIVNKGNIPIIKKIEYLKKYVNLKEQMAKILGYSTFLDYKLNEFNIDKNLFIKLISLNIDKKPINKNIVKEKYSLKQAFDIIDDISSSYLDNNIIKKLFNNIFINDKSFVLTSYKKEPAIFLKYTNDLESVDRLFHEIMHAYYYTLASDNKLIDYNTNQFVSEMFSMFNELILLNKINSEEKTNILNSIYNNFFKDAIDSLKLEYYVHQNYNNININLLKQFDNNFEKHIDYIFNDYYDINYALGFVIAFILANKVLNNILNKNQLNQLLKANGYNELFNLLKVVDIDINDINNLNTFFKLFIKKQ